MNQEQMILAGLDQEWEGAVEIYASLSHDERTELVEWLIGKHGEIDQAPTIILEQIQALACVAFVETGFRWRQRIAEDS
jgi:hypothetical protein